MFKNSPARQAYNSFVQMVQSEADAFTIEHRIAPIYYDADPSRDTIRWSKAYDPTLERAELQVYWNGNWHTIASEVPFSSSDEERKMETYPEVWGRIKSKAAQALRNS